MSETTKPCVGCGDTKELNDFHRDRRKPDGRRSRCKICTVAQQREFQLNFKAEHGVWYSTTSLWRHLGDEDQERSLLLGELHQ